MTSNAEDPRLNAIIASIQDLFRESVALQEVDKDQAIGIWNAISCGQWAMGATLVISFHAQIVVFCKDDPEQILETLGGLQRSIESGELAEGNLTPAMIAYQVHGQSPAFQ